MMETKVWWSVDETESKPQPWNDWNWNLKVLKRSQIEVHTDQADQSIQW